MASAMAARALAASSDSAEISMVSFSTNAWGSTTETISPAQSSQA